MKIITLKNANGHPDYLMSVYTGKAGTYFVETSNLAGHFKERVHLSWVPTEEQNHPSFDFLKEKELVQYDGAKVVVNEDGYASRSFLLSLLKDQEGYDSSFSPYETKDLLSAVTYMELGYFLTYGLSKPVTLGSYTPDRGVEVSVITLETSEGKSVETKLSEYVNEYSFDAYLEKIRTGARPYPLPLFYGFKNVFGDKAFSPFGQVSRKEVLNLLGGASHA